MIEIVLCDDNKVFLKKLKDRIETYLSEKKIKAHILAFESATGFADIDIKNIDIIFLDINIKDVNGIDVAKQLRSISTKFILVFLTSYIEYAPYGYNVNAFRYLLKDQRGKLLKEALDEAIELVNIDATRTEIKLKFIDLEVSVYTDTIIYIESKRHKVYFYFRNGCSHYMYNKLNTIEKLLPSEEFVRIHQSYLVNIRYFLDAKYNRAYLNGNIELPISQKLFSQVKKKLFLYRGKMTW